MSTRAEPANSADAADPALRIFLSYHFGAADTFAARIAYYLQKQPEVSEVALFPPRDEDDGFREDISTAIGECDVLVALVQGLGATQKQEIDAFRNRSTGACVTVLLDGYEPTSKELMHVSGGEDAVRFSRDEDETKGARACAAKIIEALGRKWIDDDDIPPRYVFDYEKELISDYTNLDDPQVVAKLIRGGCPPVWPDIERVPWHEAAGGNTRSSHLPLGRRERSARLDNPIPKEKIGSFRSEEERIVVDARVAASSDELPARHLTFLEAGPRSTVCFPKPGHNHLTVGIVVSGGIAPGINAVIEGIVARHMLYKNACEKRRGRRYSIRIRGYVEGMSGLLGQGDHDRTRDLNEKVVREHAYLGGSILQTARADELLDPDFVRRDSYMDEVVTNLKADGVDILYVIGGDGSMRAAHAIWTKAQHRGIDLSIVAIPKTMDNDVLWVWQAFGFLSAVDKATEVIRHLHTEVTSNPRLCVVQLFGSDSGFVVSHAGLASGIGVCDAVLIPEVPFSMRTLTTYVLERLTERYRTPDGGGSIEAARPFGIIALAETAIPTDVEEYIDDPRVGLTDPEKRAITKFVDGGRRVRGQTPDDLRTGGVKVVSSVLEREIRRQGKPEQYWQKFRVFTNEPRHLLRALPPSVSDVTFGQRLGTLAVDNAMAGFTDFMVSQWLTEYVLVPLRVVTLGRKRVFTEGIFWKSVLAATGQPADLAETGRRRARPE